jgi:hypothetical protein
MRKITMLAATAGAVLAVAGCSSHATAHPQALASASSAAHPLALAPIASTAPHVRDPGDKAACLLWDEAGTTLADETATPAALSATANKAIGEASDPAFKRDVATAVSNYEAAQKVSDYQTNEVLAMGQAMRDAVNDCAADGVAINGS